MKCRASWCEWQITFNTAVVKCRASWCEWQITFNTAVVKCRAPWCEWQVTFNTAVVKCRAPWCEWQVLYNTTANPWNVESFDVSGKSHSTQLSWVPWVMKDEQHLPMKKCVISKCIDFLKAQHIVFCSELTNRAGENICDVMAYVLDCGIIVNQFKLQSCFYIHFRMISLEKLWTPLSHNLWAK